MKTHSSRWAAILRIAAIAVVSTAAISAGLAQSIFTNPITGTNPNTVNPYTTGQTVNADLSVSGIGRGTGITGANATDRYSASSWNTASLDTTQYFAWTLTPASGYTLNLTSFVYTGQASSTGAVNFAFQSSVDGFTANVGSPTAAGTTISLSSASFQNLTSATEFRFYGWGASSAAGTFSINDFTFNGSLSAIPEPSTYAAIFGALALAGTVWHRRRQRKAV